MESGMGVAGPLIKSLGNLSVHIITSRAHTGSWPGQAKTELLFWSQRKVLANVMCHPVGDDRTKSCHTKPKAALWNVIFFATSQFLYLYSESTKSNIIVACFQLFTLYFVAWRQLATLALDLDLAWLYPNSPSLSDQNRDFSNPTFMNELTKSPTFSDREQIRRVGGHPGGAHHRPLLWDLLPLLSVHLRRRQRHQFRG